MTTRQLISKKCDIHHAFRDARSRISGRRGACIQDESNIYSRISVIFYAGRALQKRYIIIWSVVFHSEVVFADFSALPQDMRASFEKIVGIVKAHGLERTREPYVKHLDGPLWEMRLKGKDGIARAAYVTTVGRRIVVVHVFIKKTEKTPRRDIELALKRAKEVK